MSVGDLVYFNNEIHIIVGTKLILYKKSKRIVKYASVLNIKTNTQHSCPYYWLDKVEQPKTNT